jgi:hypothetical protein
MGWRFRKSFKVLPGVRLNLSRHGLSTTLGHGPFSVNVGPRGVYRTLSIPGTGLSHRERLFAPSHTVPAGLHAPNHNIVPPPIPPAPSSQTLVAVSTEIRSASTELINSHTLEDLRHVLQEAFEEREALGKEIAAAEREAGLAARRYQSWERGFLLKRLFASAFAARKAADETAQAKRGELHEQLRLTTLATQIDIDREQAEPYFKMRDDFAALTGSQRIWDTLSRRAVNRAAERTTASEMITREPVSFSLGRCDLIQWDQDVPYLPNRTGGAMYIYPGFLLYRVSRQAFALMDFREVSLSFRPLRFYERETVPSDAQLVGHAWAKANGDGTPDRRFRGNYQIPVLLYGVLTFTSRSGLSEEFQLSNAALAARFAKSWNDFQASFTAP